MKKIFCLFIVVFAMAQMLSAQTANANSSKLLKAESFFINEQPADAIVQPVERVHSGLPVEAALSGTYTIGLLNTGNPTNFNKLSDAVNALQANGVSAAVNFEFTDANYTDTSLIIGGYLGQGLANPVVFKLAAANPSAKIFFSGGLTTRTWGIRIDTASYVSFIGSTTVGTRPITFEVDTTAGNPTRSVFVVVRSNNIRLEGLQVIGFKTFNSTTTARIISETNITGNTTPNNNIVYTNLLVKRGSTFAINGITNTNRDNNVTVSNCDFGGSNIIENFSSSGLQLYFVDNLTIYKNNVQYGKNFSAATSGPVGIFLIGGHNNVVISHNKIHDIEKYGTGTGQSSGIVLQTMNGATAWGPISGCKIYNNMIYDIRNPLGINGTNQYQAVQGVYMGTLTPNSFNTIEFYNNTIYLSGSINPASYYWTPCVLINATLSTDTIKILNNVLANTIKTSNFNTGTYIYGDFAGEIVSDRNLFWYPHFPVYWSALAFSGVDLNQWQTNTLQDANSIEQSDPYFQGTTDPHIVASSLSAAEGNASVVGFVADDIDGQPRSGSTPDLGADEFTGTKWTFAIQALIQGFYQDGNFDNIYGIMVPDTVSVELHNSTSPWALVDQADVLLDSSGFGVGKFNTGWTVGNKYYIAIKHINTLETWSELGGEQLNLSALQYNFLDSAKTYDNTNTSKKVGVYWTLINGDCNQDLYIDGSDYLPIVNNWEAGDPRMPGDTNGDVYIDGSDYLQVVNNFEIGSVTPLTLKRQSKPIK